MLYANALADTADATEIVIEFIDGLVILAKTVS